MKVFSALARNGLRVVCLLFFALAPSGCKRHSGEATVISKQHIPAEPAVTELVEAAEWDKLRIGDSVQVRYSEGKYTGTVWSSDLK